MRYAINIRTPQGTNPDFIEVTPEAFATLSDGLTALSTNVAELAIYQGRGSADDWEWLQFIVVKSVGLGNNPNGPASLVDWSNPAILPDEVTPTWADM